MPAGRLLRTHSRQRATLSALPVPLGDRRSSILGDSTARRIPGTPPASGPGAPRRRQRHELQTQPDAQPCVRRPDLGHRPLHHRADPCPHPLRRGALLVSAEKPGTPACSNGTAVRPTRAATRSASLQSAPDQVLLVKITAGDSPDKRSAACQHLRVVRNPDAPQPLPVRIEHIVERRLLPGDRGLGSFQILRPELRNRVIPLHRLRIAVNPYSPIHIDPESPVRRLPARVLRRTNSRICVRHAVPAPATRPVRPA